MASVLEQYVNTVQTETLIGNFNGLVEYLYKIQDVLHKNVQHLDNVLETLDVQQHSLGYLFVLTVLCSNQNSNGVAAVAVNGEGSEGSTVVKRRYLQVQDFIGSCNGEQIRLAPSTFAELCHLYTGHLVANGDSLRGITTVQKAISKLRLFDAQLTSLHSDLCQLCLLAKCLKPALRLLDVDITGICQEVAHSSGTSNSSTSGGSSNNNSNSNNNSSSCSGGGGNSTSSGGVAFDCKYFLQYYYYGGMIYLAVRNLHRAFYFFEVAITTPARAISHIMLEAYKKYVLVSLLLHGKTPSVPKYASQVVNRFIKPLSQSYHDLSAAFATNNPTELQTVIGKHRETFQRDHNYGLVKRVASELFRKNIQKLTRTFLTLSLADVASRVGLPGPKDAERYILHMIEDEQIFAAINQKDGMVIFRDEPQKYGGPDVLNVLETQLSMCMELDKQILTMDEEIQVNPVYVRKAFGGQDDADQGQGSSGGGGSSSVGGVGGSSSGVGKNAFVL